MAVLAVPASEVKLESAELFKRRGVEADACLAKLPAAEKPQEFSARESARQLAAAIQGPGSDEAQVFAVLSGKTKEQIDEIKTQYRELTKTNLDDALKGDLSGYHERIALRLLEGHSAENMAASLTEVMRFGRRNADLYVALLGSMTETQRGELREKVNTEKWGDIFSSRHERTGAHELASALSRPFSADNIAQTLVVSIDRLGQSAPAVVADDKLKEQSLLIKTLEMPWTTAERQEIGRAFYTRTEHDIATDLTGSKDLFRVHPLDALTRSVGPSTVITTNRDRAVRAAETRFPRSTCTS